MEALEEGTPVAPGERLSALAGAHASCLAMAALHTYVAGGPKQEVAAEPLPTLASPQDLDAHCVSKGAGLCVVALTSGSPTAAR